MADWKTLLHQDQTDWLLESDSPSIGYFTRRDLLGMDENSPELLKLRDDISESPTINMLFEGQQEGGYWFHPDKYRSEVKFYGTAWRFMLLAEYGVSGTEPRVRKTAEYLLLRAQDQPSGGFKSHVLQHGDNTGLPINPCFNGMLLWSFIRFGYLADGRIQSNLDWVLEHTRFDDGEIVNPASWMYKDGILDEDDGCWGRHSCIRGVGPILLALSEIPRQQRTPRVQKTLEEGLEFVLKHHVCKKSHDLTKNMNGWITQLAYPNFWTDMLDLLFILTKEGYHDPRMEEAVRLLVRKQDQEGKWHMQRSLLMSKRQRLPIPVDEKGSPSQWITLRAMTVLRHHVGLNAT
jgi:hypothetical protein